MNVHWGVISITVGIAVGSVLVQIMLKHASRPKGEGRSTSVTLDDWVVWTDWAVLGGLSFVLALFGRLNHVGDSAQFPVATVLWALLFLFVQLLVFPIFLKAFAYERVKEDPSLIRVKGIGWVAVCNVVGGVLLAGVVQSGIDVYDWTGTGL